MTQSSRSIRTANSNGRPNSSHQTITRVLRQARGRLNPRDIPGFTATFGPKDGPGLTQSEVAHLLGVSTKWYRSLELGKPRTYSKQFLQAVRRVLKLNQEEWETVWRLTQGRPAPDTAPRPTTVDAIPPSLRRFIDAQSWPAYLCNRRWDLLHYNSAALRDYPWILHGTNVMIWVLTYPEARTQLIDWERDWAIPMIAQLRYHAELWKEDFGLQTLVSEVLADPVARALWDSPDLPVMPHPSATATRKLYLPRRGAEEFEVLLLTMQVDDMPANRMMIVIPAEQKRAATG